MSGLGPDGSYNIIPWPELDGRNRAGGRGRGGRRGVSQMAHKSTSARGPRPFLYCGDVSFSTSPVLYEVNLSEVRLCVYVSLLFMILFLSI